VFNYLRISVEFPGIAVVLMCCFPLLTWAQNLPDKSFADSVVPVQSVLTPDFVADTINVSPFFVPSKLRDRRYYTINDESQDADRIVVPCSVSVIRSKLKKDPALPIYTVITCHGMNFETVEHTECGPICQSPASVMFRENPRTVGVQFFIPGGIALMIGTIGFLAMVDNVSSGPTGQRDQTIRSCAACAVGGLTIGGALVFEGFKKARIHGRWSNRYQAKTSRY
jgi:hypothetical protein